MNTQNLMTASELLLNKGLDYKVISSPIFDNQGREQKEFKLIQREDNGHGFQVSKKGYNIIQNSEALSALDEIVQSGFAKYTDGKSFKGGAVAMVRAEVPSLNGSIKGDELKSYIHIANSFDGSLALCIFPSMQRVVCQNLLTKKNLIQAVKIRHTVNFRFRIEDAKLLFAKYAKAFEEQKQAFSLMAEKQFNSLAVDSFLNSLFDIKEEREENSTRILNQKQELARLFVDGIGHNRDGIRGTAFAMYNAVTQYIDHERGTAENRAFSSLFGSGEIMRAKAFDLLTTNYLN